MGAESDPDPAFQKSFDPDTNCKKPQDAAKKIKPYGKKSFKRFFVFSKSAIFTLGFESRN
jgi:hypothetical protein